MGVSSFSMTRPFATLAFCSAIGALLAACSSSDRPQARANGARAQGSPTRQAIPSPDPGTTMSAASDSTPIGAAEAYLARHRYQRWAPLPDDSMLPACAGLDNGGDEGVELNALWGIARGRVLRVQHSATDSTDVNVSAEVLRVLSVEGDPATSDGNYAKADMVVAEPIVDTLWMSLHHAATGWVPCGFVWYLEDEVTSPIALTGPPTDTVTPRGLPLSRWIPGMIGWARLRAMADSIAQREQRPTRRRA